mmetsp:Transcript_2572/g.2987  ORF Transcript_2572/g.2987 Transcript_2572/m.2987 type:complete len:214 (+) Transcript_2572:1112-1753(+)
MASFSSSASRCRAFFSSSAFSWMISFSSSASRRKVFFISTISRRTARKSSSAFCWMACFSCLKICLILFSPVTLLGRGWLAGISCNGSGFVVLGRMVAKCLLWRLSFTCSDVHSPRGCKESFSEMHTSSPEGCVSLLARVLTNEMRPSSSERTSFLRIQKLSSLEYLVILGSLYAGTSMLLQYFLTCARVNLARSACGIPAHFATSTSSRSRL